MPYQMDEAAERRLQKYFGTIGTCLRDKRQRATRDRLRALGSEGDSLEDVVIAALDTYEAQQFWTEAEAAAATETREQRAERKRVEAEVDRWMNALR